MPIRRCTALFAAAACALAAIATTPAAAQVAAPLPAPDSPEQVYERITGAVATGELHIAWDCLPASWQEDATNLVHDFAAKVDPEVWNRSFTIVRKAGFMMQQQKDLILSMPNFQNDPQFNHAEASEAWDRIASLFITVADSDIADARKMQTLDIRTFLGTTGGAFLSELRSLSEIAPDMDASELENFIASKASLVSMNGDNAVIRIAGPGVPANEVEMVRIEGKWIPADLAGQWPGQMAEARAALDQMTGEEFQEMKPQIMQLMGGLEMTIDQLAQAETHEQFEQTAQMGMMQIFGAVMAISSAQQQ